MNAKTIELSKVLIKLNMRPHNCLIASKGLDDDCILTWCNHGTDCDVYVFKNIQYIAYSPDLRTSDDEESGLENYLRGHLQRNKLYYASSWQQVFSATWLKIIVDETHTITIDDKDIKISNDSFEELREFFKEYEEE